MSVHGRITIAKAILISQYTYVLTILDIGTEDEIQQIQLHINNFIAYNEYEITKKRTWIPNNILYGDRKLGGFNMIKLDHFFQALKTSWINRYINGLDDH